MFCVMFFPWLACWCMNSCFWACMNATCCALFVEFERLVNIVLGGFA